MGLTMRSKISLKIKDFTDTYICQADVRVLWVVWKSVPRPIIWCSAPAVPILMLTTVRNGTRLQKKHRYLYAGQNATSSNVIKEPVFEASVNGNVLLTGTVHENLGL